MRDAHNRFVRDLLVGPVRLDPYLIDVARREESHRFLGSSTLGCYSRQVRLLAETYAAQGRDLATVRVLDWGAGKGHISYLLRKAGFDVTSCDVQSTASDSSFGQRTPILEEQSIHVIPLLDDVALPFADASFDLVVSFGVLEHVRSDALSLREIRRILKPGGRFFFSFLPYWLSWTQRVTRMRGDWYHPILYRARGVRRLASDAGFRVEGIWHGQLLPKNSLPHNDALERFDRFLTTYTPFKYFATNLEGFLIAD